MNSNHPIWSLSPEEVYKNLTTYSQGLSEAEATLRLKQYGYNELPEPQTRSLILRFIDQLNSFYGVVIMGGRNFSFYFPNSRIRLGYLGSNLD